ncbi:MAG: aspartate carbamoyltransferase regulatory subunit [Nanoarchaeota archaeon]|nr:aspartate carbamoyltransferase regulatory subunit [Nanoarchaeota archaeon]
MEKKNTIEEKAKVAKVDKIFRLRTGIVIDHIPAFKSFEVVELLGLDHPGEGNAVMAIGVNLKSKKHTAKDVIKVENMRICKEEINKISMIAPRATVSMIRDHKIKDKIRVKIPDVVEGLLKCPNHNCVTNFEPVKTKFHHNSGQMKCHFCEKSFNLTEMKLL